MLKKVRFILLATALFLGISATTYYNDKLFEITKNLEIFVSAYKELNTNFADELDPSILMRTAIDAMTNSLDPFTNFISESQAESYRIFDDEKYQGIGARAGISGEKVYLIEVFENGPAYDSGLKAGDELYSIDGTSVAGKKLEEVNGIMRGIPGSKLALGIKPYGEDNIKTVQVIRGEVNIPNVPYSGFVKDNVGYINLTIFTANAGANIGKAIKEFKEDNPNLSGIILDLRDNGGGLLHEAVNICNHFIPQNELVVSTRSKVKENDRTFKTMTSPLDLELPVAVLINKRSASASEIVSGVLQDLDRGVIIGQRSYGKGLVQNYKDLPYNARLKLTTSKYYIPSGRCIQGLEYENGVPKDIPDSQRSKFKTKNGRTVLDGGGVTPDIVLTENKLKEVTQALKDQFIIFQYVNEYTKGKDSIDQAGEFRFDKFDEFVAFTQKKKFSFESETEKSLKEAKEKASEARNISVVNQIETLLANIKSSKANELKEAKNEIVQQIESEIISRYYYQKGKVKQNLAGDVEVLKAIEILQNPSVYKKILSGK